MNTKGLIEVMARSIDLFGINLIDFKFLKLNQMKKIIVDLVIIGTIHKKAIVDSIKQLNNTREINKVIQLRENMTTLYEVS